MKSTTPCVANSTTMRDRTLQALGLARRAGRIIDGEGQVLASIAKNPKGVVFLASDAGDNIRKKVTDKCRSFGVRLSTDYSSDQLSHALGKPHRKAVLLMDAGFIDSQS